MPQTNFKIDVSRRFKNKTGYDHGYDLNTSFVTETHTPQSFIDTVITQGWPYTMAHQKRSPQETGAYKRGVTTPKHIENFVSMQVATFDDDSGEGNVVQFWLDNPFFSRYGWAFVESANSKPDRQKGHPTFIFDRPVTDPDLYKECLQAFCTAYPRLDWLVNIDRTIYNGEGAKVHKLGNICPFDIFEKKFIIPYRKAEQEKQRAIEKAQAIKKAEWEKQKQAGKTVSSSLEEAWLAGWLDWLFDKVANTQSGGNPSRNGAIYWAGRAISGAQSTSWTSPYNTMFNDVEQRIIQAATANGYLNDYANGQEREILRIFNRGMMAGGQVLDEPRPTAPIVNRESGKDAFSEIMARVASLREEQARGWLAAATNPKASQKDFSAEVRNIFSDAGALTELQIMEVLDEVMRNPPLAPRKKTELLKMWRIANKEIRDAIQGKATDDEIAAAYRAKYDNKRMYSRGRWYQWNGAGVWTDQADVVGEIWQTMIEFKAVDINPTSNKRRSIEECLQGLSFLGVHESQLDSAPSVLNLANGLYNIETGELVPHQPDQYQTTQLPFEFDPMARCPMWKKFIHDVLIKRNGEPDHDMIHFMCQAFGYSLTAWTKYETSFWLQGNGANGKSTLIYVLSELTGTASMALNLGMLERDLYQLALLPGIRVVTCTESPVGMKVADSTIKSLISGDRISVRLPYSQPFQLDPVCKIWWAMNNLPRVADTSEGFWRKVKVIPFRAKFEGVCKDEDLRQKLITELPGIFNWALAGLYSLIDDGWIKCQAIDEATNAYKISNDIEAAFIDSECVTGPTYTIQSQDLYDAYKLWCERTGHRPKTMTRIASEWLRLGFEKERETSGIYYVGVALGHKPLNLGK